MVDRFDYRFNLVTLTAQSTLHIGVTPPGGDCYRVASALPVSNVTWNGEPAASATSADGQLEVCGEPIASGSLRLTTEQTVPEATFGGTDVGFYRRLDFAGNTFSHLLSWVGECDRFGPCDDRASLLARYGFEVKHAPDDVVLCPGERTVSDTLTRCTLNGTAAPTYSAFMLASNRAWQRRTFAQFDDMSLEFFEVAGERLASRLDPASVTQYVRWMVSQFGPLPYGNVLRFAGAPISWLGIEHPGNILLRENLPDLRPDYKDMVMHTVMHEIAHQWAGDRVTLSDPMDFVWKEAIAEYLTYVFEDTSRPTGEAAQTRAYWDRMARGASYYPRPEDDPPPPLLSITADAYTAGPELLFLQLEPLLGRDVLLGAIRRFLQEPGHRSVWDLRVALEAQSGADLGRYFDLWIFGSDFPERPYFAVSTQRNPESHVTHVTATQQTGSGNVYPCVLQVQLNGPTRTVMATLNYGLAPVDPTRTVTVDLDEDVSSIVVDPESRVSNRRFAPFQAGFDVEETSRPSPWRL